MTTLTTAPSLPREHVARPGLPWRTASLTECGRPIADLKHVISRDQLAVKIKRQGKQRAGLTTCMSCMDTAQRWASFAEDPVRAIDRETALTWREMHRFARELRAIALLIDAHRDEFEQILTALNKTVTLRAPLGQRRISHRGHC